MGCGQKRMADNQVKTFGVEIVSRLDSIAGVLSADRASGN